MSIEKECGFFSLYCDVCGAEADEQFDEFYDAVEYKKSEGWKSQKRNGEWEDVCPDCQEK
jgi:hypothetical protein